VYGSRVTGDPRSVVDSEVSDQRDRVAVWVIDLKELNAFVDSPNRSGLESSLPLRAVLLLSALGQASSAPAGRWTTSMGSLFRPVPPSVASPDELPAASPGVAAALGEGQFDAGRT
jgi:hypothetical protein